MITFLSSPKAFTGHAGKIQRNAIRSWQAVHPEAEVIIYGDGEGIAEACREIGVCHIPHIPCSSSGIPYFNSIVEHACAHARYDVQCYLNCDILMPKEVIKAIRSLEFPRYLVIGQRIDLAEGEEIDVTSCYWKIDLQMLIEHGKASLHASTGIDYFIFTRGVWDGLLPLVIGRGGYDNALLAFCLRQRIPIINATTSIAVLHQFHDYAHIAGGVSVVMHGTDAKQNMLLHGVKHSPPSVTDATWIMHENGILTDNHHCDILRKFELFLRFKLRLVLVSYVVRQVWRLLYFNNTIK